VVEAGIERAAGLETYPASLALRLRRERALQRMSTPRICIGMWTGRRGSEPRDERVPPDHSITSSVRASKEPGTLRPSALAVLRFRTNSYLVGCCTARSAGFSPFIMRSI